jgi:hypothetical protein
MNFRIFIVALFLFSGVFSHSIQMMFQSKQCESTPWNNWYSSGGIKFFADPTDSQLITAYLGSKGITITSSSKVESGNMVCSACGCPTSYYYVVTAKKRYQQQLVNLGFSLK